LVCSVDGRVLDGHREALATRGIAVLAKPFRLEELLAALAGLLGRPSTG
jgi:hypothetical protein